MYRENECNCTDPTDCQHWRELICLGVCKSSSETNFTRISLSSTPLAPQAEHGDTLTSGGRSGRTYYPETCLGLDAAMIDTFVITIFLHEFTHISHHLNESLASRLISVYE